MPTSALLSQISTWYINVIINIIIITIEEMLSVIVIFTLTTHYHDDDHWHHALLLNRSGIHQLCIKPRGLMYSEPSSRLMRDHTCIVAMTEMNKRCQGESREGCTLTPTTPD